MLQGEFAFSFWDWFFAVMKMMKSKLMPYWNAGYVTGFISKRDSQTRLCESSNQSMLLRFSDSLPGAVSIAFATENRDVLHLEPMTIADLNHLSLAQRITSCPQFEQIESIYPNLKKSDMIQLFGESVRNRASHSASRGYTQLIMVVKNDE